MRRRARRPVDLTPRAQLEILEQLASARDTIERLAEGHIPAEEWPAAVAWVQSRVVNATCWIVLAEQRSA